MIGQRALSESLMDICCGLHDAQLALRHSGILLDLGEQRLAGLQSGQQHFAPFGLVQVLVVRLARAMKRLDLLFEETEQLYRNTSVSTQLCELRNLISVGYLIVKSASFRKESRGLHFNTDYPEKSSLKENIIL